MSCLILRFSRKSNKSRVLSWLTGTKTSVVEKRTNSFIDLLFSVRIQKSQKYCSRASEHLFKNEKLFFWEKLTKSKTPGLSFSSKKRDLVFLWHLVKKKVRTLDLDFVQRKKFKVPKRDFRVYMKYLKVNKWFCLTHYHLISYWNNYYEHTCTPNQLLDSLQVKLKPMTV